MKWLLVYYFALLFSPSLSEIHYVSSHRAGSSADCSSVTNRVASCHELSFYTNRTEQYFNDDSIFIFLEGTHLIQDVVVIDGVKNLSLIGAGIPETGYQDFVTQTTVVLSCNRAEKNAAGLMFINVTNLNLIGLTITECNFSPSDISFPMSVNAFYAYLSMSDTFVYNSSRFISSVFMIEVTALTYRNMSIQNATNFGLVGVNIFNSSIKSSSFAINNIEAFELFEGCSTLRNFGCSGGNALIVFTYSWVYKCSAVGMRFMLDISSSNFSNGFGNMRYDYFNSIGGGLTIFMDQGDLYEVDVTVDHIISYNNTGQLCGNINFLTGMGTKYFSFVLINSRSSYGNQKLMSNASSGGGLQISLGVTSSILSHNCPQINTLSTSNTSIHIIASHFTHNIARYGGAINVWVNKTFAEIYVDSCSMVSNYGWRGIAMYINQNNFDTILKYVFENVTVRHSIYLGTVQSSEDYRSSISLFRMKNFKFVNLVVEDNFPNFGAYLYYSKVNFDGTKNRFSNCSSAGSGGGLHLSALSAIVFEPGAVVTFESNHANVQGGAIYADTNQLLSPLCFMETKDPPPRLIFINNTASEEGDAVYIGRCTRLQNDEMTNEATKILDTFDTFHQLGEEPVSSAPYSVSYCRSSSNNSIEETQSKKIVVHPGETIALHIATLGIRNTISSGLMKVDIFTTDNEKLHTLYRYSKSSCFNITYKVYNVPTIKNLKLVLTTNQEQFTSTGFSLQKSVTALVGILVCPAGFEIFNDECVCNRMLQRYGNITGDISTHLFTREGNIWFGYDNTTGSLLVDTRCPFDYCIKRSVSFPIHTPDDQCDLNRSGKVCGQCSNGMSLMLGSNICGYCSNLWLILIIPFSIAAGVALVAFLMILNLTVSVGTINGLIFYANVIKLSEFSFFPNDSIPVLSQFISWINLDFGITCCFYNGFNAVAKLWMQFLFPAYIFCIIIVIIILCKFSTKASDLFGHNAVPVFATLILLSYTKLFRLIVPIFQFKHITVISNSSITDTQLVWAVDPNIPYTSFSHMSLVVVAILVVLVLVLPYKVALVFQLVMLKFRHNSFQKLCLNFKPVFDAYYGPFKTKSMLWPGILLCARLILVAVASASTDSQLYLSCTTAIVVVLLTLMIGFQGVYNELYLNVLESCFLLNLAIIAIFVEREPIVTIIGVGSVLLMFCGIVGLHIAKKPSVLAKLKKLKVKEQKKAVDVHAFSEANHISRSSISSTSLELKREPLIFSDDSF